MHKYFYPAAACALAFALISLACHPTEPSPSVNVEGCWKAYDSQYVEAGMPMLDTGQLFLTQRGANFQGLAAWHRPGHGPDTLVGGITGDSLTFTNTGIRNRISQDFTGHAGKDSLFALSLYLPHPGSNRVWHALRVACETR